MKTEVSTEALEQLFTAADAYRELAPWKWMQDHQLFGVVNPATGEKGYCTVMGNLGDYLALGLYPGAEGYRSYVSLFGDLEEEDGDPQEAVYTQRCLVAAFEYQEELAEDDLLLARKLGRDYQAQRAWPDFRSYQPGMAPWSPNPAEVTFLTVALEQAVDVARRARLNLDLVPEYKPSDGKPILFRKQVDGEWQDAQIVPDPPVNLSPAQLRFDRDAVSAAVGTLEKANAIWLFEMFFLPAPIMEDQDVRPYFPKAMVLMDIESGRILGLDAVRAREVETDTADSIIEIFQHFRAIPGEIVVSSRDHYILIKEFCRLLDITLHMDEEIDVVDGLREDIFEQMMGDQG
ncbi:MAG: hypothetical protein AAGN35_23020 [Bacteroidota bacterium]